MRRTKIVATIGPASRDPRRCARMVQAGMDVARLNFSHGSVEQHAETSQRVRDAANAAGRPVAILQDLPGPKLRIGQLRDDRVELETGETVTFVCHERRARRRAPDLRGRPGAGGRRRTRGEVASTSPTGPCGCA